MKQLLLLILIIINQNLSIANELPYQLRDTGVLNKIDTKLTKDIILSDEFDNEINLLDLINNQPTIINFVYLNCPLLCHLLLDGIVDVSKRSDYKIGEDYQVISISIDPKETNKNLTDYKKKYLNAIEKENGWLFLKGKKESIDLITEELGYKYKYIQRTNDYAHPSVLFFYNKKLTNYIEGVTFDVQPFNYSIISTKVSTSIKEKIITYCYYFDPDNQTYTMIIFKIVRIACLLTVVILSIIILNLIRKERYKNNYGN